LPEIRVDPLSGHRTIVAGERSRRPGGEPRCPPAAPIDRERDPFAEGSEQRTPPELYALRPHGGEPNGPGWSVRVVPNLYPALTPPDPAPTPSSSTPSSSTPSSSTPSSSTPLSSTPLSGDSSESGSLAQAAVQPAPLAAAWPEPQADARPELYTAYPAEGWHEVIVNGPQSVQSLAELPLEQVQIAFQAWRERMRVHAREAAYVQLIVNERREGGASLEHTHAQLYALPWVPAEVARERERAGAYATRTMGGDLLGDLIAEEVRRRDRIVAIDEEAVLLAPWASRVPFQLMLAPRRPHPRFEDEPVDTLGAALLHEGLQRLRAYFGASPPLNLWVRTAPRGVEKMSWRIDVMPRLTHLAGLELSTGVNVNIVAPEDAAAWLRGESA
jgi:UDPglucose--hexose-1-phosphate uridylyltransferase